MSPNGNISQPLLFLQQYTQHFFEIGAILPSSPALGRAAAAYLARKKGPARVLEVGAGTGAFTAEIVPRLQAGDRFDVVEINPKLIAVLRRRFEQEKRFQTQASVRMMNEDIRTAPLESSYDYIIFSLPLTNFPPALVQEILSLMVERLKPGGVFSYVRYIFLGRLKYALGGAKVRTEMQANQEIIRGFTAKYQIRQQAVLLNVPPAWTFYWQKPTERQ